MSSGERERLRRIAYGPDATPHERAVAEKSLHELDERALEAAPEAQNPATLEAQQSAEAVLTIEEPAEHAESVDRNAVDSGDEPVTPSLWNRTLRVGWLVPLVAGCLILGATVALSTTGPGGDDKGSMLSGDGSTSVSQGTTIEHMIVPTVPGHGPGNVDAANDWLADPAAANDEFLDGTKESLDSLGIDQSDVRSVGHDVALQQNLLIARHGADGFCMISVGGGAGPSWFSSCVTIEEFEASGLSLSGPGFAAYWDGESISTAN